MTQLRRLYDLPAGPRRDMALFAADVAMQRGKHKGLKRYLKHKVGTHYAPGHPKHIKNWTVYSLDVVGNPEDGYMINDSRQRGNISIPDGSDRAKIVSILKNAGYLRNDVTVDQVTIDFNDDVISVMDAEDGEPVYQLEHREGALQSITPGELRRSRKHRGRG